MITSSLLYASIFGHVTTIIHNMTLAAAKYHNMLNNVREFMVLNEVTTTRYPLNNVGYFELLGASQSYRACHRLHCLKMDKHQRGRTG